jgi:hypothetical protein
MCIQTLIASACFDVISVSLIPGPADAHNRKCARGWQFDAFSFKKNNNSCIRLGESVSATACLLARRFWLGLMR